MQQKCLFSWCLCLLYVFSCVVCVCVFVHPGVLVTTGHMNYSFSHMEPHLGMFLRICECAVTFERQGNESFHIWASVVGGGGRDPIRRKHSPSLSISLMHTTLMCFLTVPVPAVTQRTLSVISSSPTANSRTNQSLFSKCIPSQCC